MAIDVARALGDLEGTVRAMAEQWRRQEEIATAGRRGVYDRIDSLSLQVTTLQSAATAVQQDVAEIKKDMDEKVMPAIDAYSLDKARRLGWMDSGRLIWAGVIGACTLIGFVIHEILQYLAKAGSLPHLPIP